MQVREIKRHLNGAQQTFYCDLLYRDQEVMVLRFQTTEDPYAAVAHVTEGYFWQDRNYLVYKMFNQFGDLVGHRFDVCRDMRFGPDSVEWTDLHLDFFVSPVGDLRVLDEEEVAEAIAAGELCQGDQEIINRTRALLEGSYGAVLQEIAELRRRVALPAPVPRRSG